MTKLLILNAGAEGVLPVKLQPHAGHNHQAQSRGPQAIEPKPLHGPTPGKQVHMPTWISADGRASASQVMRQSLTLPREAQWWQCPPPIMEQVSSLPAVALILGTTNDQDYTEPKRRFVIDLDVPRCTWSCWGHLGLRLPQSSRPLPVCWRGPLKPTSFAMPRLLHKAPLPPTSPVRGGRGSWRYLSFQGSCKREIDSSQLPNGRWTWQQQGSGNPYAAQLIPCLCFTECR